MKPFRQFILILALLLLPLTGWARIQGPGEGVHTYTGYKPYAKMPVELHYFIPTDGDISTMPILMVLQGADRGWTYLMQTWRQEAQKYRFIVLIPVFTKEIFPLNEYQEMGVFDAKGRLNKPRRTAAVLADKMFEWFRDEIGGQQQHYSLYGHSAGGQFVHRALLLHNSPYVDRAVVGSPGWYTYPDNQGLLYPYGLTNVPYVKEKDIIRFLQHEAVVQISDGDTVRESFLRKTPEAEMQGRNREERGRGFYGSIEQAAHRLGIQHHWSLVCEHDVAHHSQGMGKRAIPYLFPDLVRQVDCTRVMTPTEVTQRLQALIAPHANEARLTTIGQTPLGQDIPALYIGSRDDNKLRVWIEASLHGNEPAGTLTVCQYADYLLNSAEGRDICQKLSFMIVPMANVDGYASQKRLSGTRTDLNRDQSLLTDTVTWMLKRAYADWQPHLAIDLHEYRPEKADFAELTQRPGRHIAIGRDILLLPSGHPNVDPAIRALNDTLQSQIGRDLDAASYTHDFYFTATRRDDGSFVLNKDGGNPRSSTTFQALTNAVSLFFEVKGIGLSEDLLPRRSDVGLEALRSAIRKAASIAPYIEQQVTLADQRAQSAQSTFVARSHPALTQEKVVFEDLETGRFFTQEVQARDAMQQQPDLVKPRPIYYQLPVGDDHLVDRLRTMGIQVEGYRVPVAQRLGNLVVTLLDPQSMHFAFDSYDIQAITQ